jgi:hypothetical protein
LASVEASVDVVDGKVMLLGRLSSPRRVMENTQPCGGCNAGSSPAEEATHPWYKWTVRSPPEAEVGVQVLLDAPRDRGVWSSPRGP